MTTRTPGRRPNRRGEGALLRGELVAAASALLEEGEGEQSLSLRAVARRAGVAPQSVYLHFADVRALLVAVYEARFGELLAVLDGAGGGGGERGGADTGGGADGRARLRALCLAYCAYGQAHPGHYRVLFGTAGSPGWEPDQMAGLPALALLDAAVRVAGLARDGGAAGGGGPEGEGAGVAPQTLGLWAALHGLVTLRRDRPGFPWPPVEVLVDALLDVRGGGGVRAAS
ncbi:TetR/AcrR family transcriptional regulator [Kitasatospora phosalacinea]|uniref:TetR/AcrR family transcriptional regulator n=1 Tax=Kitasatospora phosalacinea TaxID=2065 RepID=UPI0035E09700